MLSKGLQQALWVILMQANIEQNCYHFFPEHLQYSLIASELDTTTLFQAHLSQDAFVKRATTINRGGRWLGSQDITLDNNFLSVSKSGSIKKEKLLVGLVYVS